MEAVDHEEMLADHGGMNGFEGDLASDKGSGSTNEDPVTPNNLDSAPDSPHSDKSTESSSSEEVDTDVLLSNESVQAMAETIGIQLDDEASSEIAGYVLNKLRHVTLLALQFSRHGHSVGLRVSDFTKAEKVSDKSQSLGYGYSHSLPEYLDFGGFCTEFEGADVDVRGVIRNPIVNEVTVDSTADPMLNTRYVHHHDKLSKDQDEGRMCPDFYNILTESNFHQCLLEDWDYRENLELMYTNGILNGHCKGELSPQILPDLMELPIVGQVSPHNSSGSSIQAGSGSSRNSTVNKEVDGCEPMDVDENFGRQKRGRETDIYKSAEFLRTQDKLGDDIFMDENTDEEPPAIANASISEPVAQQKKYPSRAVSPDITETRSKKFSRPPTIAPASAEPASRETSNNECYSDGEPPCLSSEDSDSSSEESGTEDCNSNNIDDDFEVVIDPDPETLEPQLSDTDGEDFSDDEEETEIMCSNQELPLEWGTYLKHFLITFYENEKRYDTFEKISYSYYLDDEEDEELPVLTDFDIILRDLIANGVFPVFHIILEFFYNYVGGKYLHIGNKQLRRITTFAKATVNCSVSPKLCHLKPLLAVLLDMLTLPVPCKLQQCTAVAILKVADHCPYPFNLELIRWITCYITAILQRSSKISVQQLTPSIKSRVCGAVHLALGYDQRGIRPQRMHIWMKNILMISQNHYVVHNRPPESFDPKTIPYDSSDSYLEEAILKFISTYAKSYWRPMPTGSLIPLLENSVECYGEKLSFLFSKPEYLNVGSKRPQRTKKKERLEAANTNVTVNEFLVRRGIIDCRKRTKIQIPFAMCVL